MTKPTHCSPGNSAALKKDFKRSRKQIHHTLRFLLKGSGSAFRTPTARKAA